MRKVTFAAAAVALLGFSVLAHADTLKYRILDGTTVIGSGSTTTGVVTGGTGTDSNFTVTIDAVGSPAQPAPFLSTSDFNIASTGVGGTLVIEITDMGLKSPGTGVTNTFTTNSLDGGGFTGDTISNYYDSSNMAYGTANLLGTATFDGNGGFSQMGGMLDPMGNYSETTIYTVNFAAGAPESSINASSQIVATTPEPNSLVLLGTGLFGAAGLLFMRRRTAENIL